MNLQTGALILATALALVAEAQSGTDPSTTSTTYPSTTTGTSTPALPPTTAGQTPATTSTATNTPSLIREVQQSLRTQGFSVSSNGLMDNQTIMAIKSFQARNG